MSSENNILKMASSRRVRFAGFDLDLKTHELFSGDRRVALPLQSLRLLELLISRHKQLVTRDEIRDEIWPDRHVDFEAGINTAIKNIRRALNDEPIDPKIIETVPRRGYRFMLTPEFSNGSAAPSLNAARRNFTPQRLGAVVVIAILAMLTLVFLPNRAPSPTAADEDGLEPLASPGYEQTLFGSHAMSQGDPEKARTHFANAIALDESYAPAYVGLAQATVFTRGGDFSKVAEAQSILNTALDIDPQSSDAHHLNARIALYHWRDHGAAERALARAMELAPDDPDVLTTAAYFHTIMGDSDTALLAIARAHKISPLSPSLNADYGWVHYKARNWDDAERLCKTSVRLNGASAFALECVIHINHSQQDFAEAADYGLRLMTLRGASAEEIEAVRAIPDAREREWAFWRWTLRWIDQTALPNQYAKRAIALARLERRDEAAAALSTAFERNGEPFLSFVAVDPRVDELRSHRDFDRFAELSRTPVAPPTH